MGIDWCGYSEKAHPADYMDETTRRELARFLTEAEGISKIVYVGSTQEEWRREKRLRRERLIPFQITSN